MDNSGFSYRGEAQLGPVCQRNEEQMLCLAEGSRKPIRANGHSALTGLFCKGLEEETLQDSRVGQVSVWLQMKPKLCDISAHLVLAGALRPVRG